MELSNEVLSQKLTIKYVPNRGFISFKLDNLTLAVIDLNKVTDVKVIPEYIDRDSGYSLLIVTYLKGSPGRYKLYSHNAEVILNMITSHYYNDVVLQ